jgi:hypothetical protein
MDNFLHDTWQLIQDAIEEENNHLLRPGIRDARKVVAEIYLGVLADRDEREREQKEGEEGLSAIDRERIEAVLDPKRPLRRVDYMIDPCCDYRRIP